MLCRMSDARFTILFLICSSAAVSSAQSPAGFEVAAIKQMDESVPPGQKDLSFVGTAGKPFKITGNRVAVAGTMRALISDAYGIKDYQIAGLPSWADSLRFSVTAKAA